MWRVIQTARWPVITPCSIRPASAPASLRQDPLLWRWWQHLRQDPVPPRQSVLFSRRVLDAEAGEALSGVQAAC